MTERESIVLPKTAPMTEGWRRRGSLGAYQELRLAQTAILKLHRGELWEIAEVWLSAGEISRLQISHSTAYQHS